MRATHRDIRYRNFGAFRFLLACMVMLQHFAANAAPIGLSDALQPLEPGSIAVLVFFALSGFVICEAADSIYRERPVPFLANRLLRIVPHFMVAVLLSVVVTAICLHQGVLRVSLGTPMPGAGAFAPGNLLAGLFSFLPAIDRFMHFNFIEYGWAIRVEMAFYLVIFLCLRAGMGGYAMLLAAAAMVPLFVATQLGHAPAMFGYAPYFVFGGAVYFLLQSPGLALAVAASASLGMAWQFLSLPPLHPVLGYARDVMSQFTLLALLLAVLVTLALPRLDEMRGDRLLGNLTYPIYLYHAPIMLVTLAVMPARSTAAFLGGIGASLLVSILLYLAVDPAIARLRDRLRGRRIDAARAPRRRITLPVG